MPKKTSPPQSPNIKRPGMSSHLQLELDDRLRVNFREPIQPYQPLHEHSTFLLARNNRQQQRRPRRQGIRISQKQTTLKAVRMLLPIFANTRNKRVRTSLRRLESIKTKNRRLRSFKPFHWQTQTPKAYEVLSDGPLKTATDRMLDA